MGDLPPASGKGWARRMRKVFADSIAVNRSLVNKIIMGRRRGKTHSATVATSTWSIYTPTASSGLVYTRVHFDV